MPLLLMLAACAMPPFNQNAGGIPFIVSDTSSALYGQPNPLFTQPKPGKRFKLRYCRIG